jgi:hypothetical protein
MPCLHRQGFELGCFKKIAENKGYRVTGINNLLKANENILEYRNIFS